MTSALDRQWIEVFRAGDYGSKGKWTVASLDQLAESYDPAKHAAPCLGARWDVALAGRVTTPEISRFWNLPHARLPVFG